MDLTELVRRAQKGDRDAQGELYQQTWQRVYFLARSMVKNPEDAMDVVQDSFIAAFGHLNTLRDPAAFVSWLQQITANRCRKHLRRQKHMMDAPQTEEDTRDFFDGIPDPNEALLPENVLEEEAKQTLILEAIQALPDAQRECVLLFYYTGLSVEEIAALQECAEGTVKSRLNYGRKKIRDSVLAIEERDGIRLHNLAPIGLFLTKVAASTAPASQSMEQVWNAIAAGMGSAAGAAGAVGASGTAGGAVKGGMFATLRAKIIAGVTAAAVVTGGVAVVSQLPKPLAFTDPGLEQSIRVLVDKPSGKLYAGDCADLTEIIVFDDGLADLAKAAWEEPTPTPGTAAVSSLSDLQQLPQVESITFWGGNAQQLCDSLGQNEGLRNITGTCRWMEPLTDLSFVRKLPNLEHFAMQVGEGVDVSPLEEQTPLVMLQLGYGGHWSLDLSNLTNLTYLGMMPMSEGRRDMGELRLDTDTALPNLRMVELLAFSYPTLEFVRNMPNLEYLEISPGGGDAPDLTPVGTLQKLRYFSCIGGFCDLSPLASCESLELWYADGVNPPPQAPRDDTFAVYETIGEPLRDELWGK